MELTTPYYRTIVKFDGTTCKEEADNNFYPYLLFCLRTRLAARVAEYLGTGYDIGFPTQEEFTGSRMRIVVKILSNQQPITLTEDQHNFLQKEIDDITTQNIDSCLILSPFLPLRTTPPLPISWFRQIISYLWVDPTLNPYVDKYGLYIVLTRYPNYEAKYGRLCLALYQQLIDMYSRGYILHAASIADDWDLEPVDDYQILYRARWTDQRFAPDLVTFLIQRLTGQRSITLNLDHNFVIRHQVAELLTRLGIKFEFQGYQLELEVQNLDQAREICSQVYTIDAKSEGKVAITVSDNPVITTQTGYPSLTYLASSHYVYSHYIPFWISKDKYVLTS